MLGGGLCGKLEDDDDDYDDDDDDDDDGLPANYHQSYSHQVGICHNVKGGNMTLSNSHHTHR